jgi:hypothetical protein
METKDFTNDANLPEKGAQEANNEETKAVTTKNNTENPAEEVKNTEEPTEENTSIVENADEGTPEENTSGASKTIPMEDYSVYDKNTLITKMNDLVRHQPVEKIKDHVEEIKVNYYKKYKAEKQEAYDKFIEEGGNAEEFKFSDDSSEETFKVIYNLYKDKRNEHSAQQEEKKKTNLKEKYEVIEAITELINKEESINKTFQEFRELQDKWRETGLVPQNDVKNLWESYHHAVEKFYDYIKINKELRDLDLKKNMEEKITLCEKAEALLLEDSITKAFKVLQDYHSTWREIGPVPRDHKEELWERFKAATTKINKKHQEFFENLKDQQVKNLEQKTALCEKIDEILAVELEKPQDWENKANEIIEIQKLWRTIGFAPKKDNNKIYQRFKDGCDLFFSRKRDFYKATKDVQKQNLQFKLDLCVQAEALKDSEEWKKTTEDFINLQKKWKTIGPVPKKHSEVLWKRFRTACDAFFDRKSEFFSTIDEKQEENLKLKLELIEKVKVFEKSDDEKASLQQLMAFQKEWSNIGHVPIQKKDEVMKAFREAIDEKMSTIKIASNDKNKANFKSKIETWASDNKSDKMYGERNKLITKIRDLENEIALYENNIGFFSNSKSAKSMIDDINRKIEKAKERIVLLKEKVKMLDDLDQ